MEAKTTAATLIRQAAESVAGVDDPLARMAMQVGYLQGTIRTLCAEYTGAGAKPQAGCAFYTATAGDATVLVEYEYEPGEAPCYDVESPGVGPGSSASVTIGKALVNGAWCDPTDVFSDALIERWQEKIADFEAEVAREQREGFERDRYDDAHDFAEAQDGRAELRGGAYAAAVREAA